MSEIKQDAETVVVSVDEKVTVSAEASGPQTLIDQWTERIVWFLLFLLPIIFLPTRVVPFDATKKYLFAAAVLVALLLWTLGRFRSAKVRIVSDPVLGAMTLIPLAVATAAFFSPVPRTSFLGISFDVGTVAFLVAGVVGAWLVAAYALRTSFARNYYRWLGLLVLVVVGFQILRLALPEIFSFAPFLDPTLTLVGKWNDFGIFLGLTSLLSIIALMDRTVRPGFARIVFLLSLVGLVAVNLYSVWLVVGISALGLVIYEAVLGPGGKRRVSIPGVILVGACLAFILAGAPDQFVGRQVARLGLPSVIEVRPSWSATAAVASDALKQNLFFGIGPNRFVSQWLLSKPAEVNQTIFWEIDFNNGVGYIPVFLATSGLVGALAWFLFLAALVISGLRTFTYGQFDEGLLVPGLMVWLSALYLWFFAFIYTPDTALIIMAFMLTGLYAAVAARLWGRKSWTFSLSHSETFGIIGSALLVAVGIVAPMGGGILLARKAYALAQFERATLAARTGNLDEAARLFEVSATYDGHDVASRLVAEASVGRLNQIIDSGDGSAETQKKFQDISNTAIIYARRATQNDPTRYTNWVTLGGVYRVLSNLKVQGAYEAALDSYSRALQLYPRSPGIYFEIARLELGRGSTKTAKELLQKSLEFKTNYTDAVLLLSQIESDAGNVSEAIKKAQQAATLAPDNAGVFFQLGLLQYRQGSYSAAATSLERAVAIIPSYSNARYFLGLTYDKLGRRTDARNQFLEIQKYNTGNKEVEQILKNLSDGRPILESVSGGAPERRETSPIEE